MSTNNLNSTASNEEEERMSEEQLADDELSELYTLKDIIENFHGNPNSHRVHRIPYHIRKVGARIFELESIMQGEDRGVAKEKADKILYEQTKEHYKLIILNIDTINDLGWISEEVKEGGGKFKGITQDNIESADEFAALTAKKRLKHKLSIEQEETLRQLIESRRKQFPYEFTWAHIKDVIAKDEEYEEHGFLYALESPYHEIAK